MIYVMSDIHGSMNRFQSVMSQINLTAEDSLYVLGDVIDRGHFGIRVLQELMEIPNATVLLGNHELMMLNALTKITESREELRLWYQNGGKITHIDYFALEPNEQFAMLEYIRQMPLTAEVTINGNSYLMVHGAPPQLYGQLLSDAENEIEFTVWTRLMPKDMMPFGKTVIFGHTPTAYYQEDVPLRIWYGGDKIGIDCGAGKTHSSCRLACLRLDDMTEFYSEY
ncbi:MAG: metallophosphoesterase [Acutalibacteraceae bacterium]